MCREMLKGKLRKTINFLIKKPTKSIRMKGSSTVEAALVMPIILTVLFLLIYLTQFVYARAQLSKTAYVSVLRASQAENKGKNERLNIATEQFDSLLSGDYLGVGSCTKDITEQNELISIHVNLNLSPRQVTFLENGFVQSAFTSEATYQAKVCHPAEFIRKCRKLETINIGNGGTTDSGN